MGEVNKNIPRGKIVSAPNLGSRIRQRRKTLGLTLQDVSSTCGVGVRFLSELERGKETAELGKVLLVIKFLGMDLYMEARDAN